MSRRKGGGRRRKKEKETTILELAACLTLEVMHLQVCLCAREKGCSSISKTAGPRVVCVKTGAGHADNLLSCSPWMHAYQQWSFVGLWMQHNPTTTSHRRARLILLCWWSLTCNLSSFTVPNITTGNSLEFPPWPRQQGTPKALCYC